ncbi:hypothetical protein KI387_011502, partial [Taxus chinensis]
ITPKKAIGMSPFQLLYGVEAEIPLMIKMPTLKLLQAIEDGQYKDSIDKRILFLEKLEENRLQVVDRIKENPIESKEDFLIRRPRQENSKLETSSCYGTREENQKAAMESLIHYGSAHSRFMKIM